MDAKYQVLSQDQVFSTMEDGSVGQVVRIKFRTESGVIGQVEVPARTYSVETAKAAIEARVAVVEEIANL